MKADEMFGWKPQPMASDQSPIPLCYGLVQYNIFDLIKLSRIVYLGKRYKNSHLIHQSFANKTAATPYPKKTPDGKNTNEYYQYSTYQFKLPKQFLLGSVKIEDAFSKFSESMAQNDQDYIKMEQHFRNAPVEEPISGKLALKFDSDFESGNLELAARTFEDRIDEYDLIMRLDSNSRTH